LEATLLAWDKVPEAEPMAIEVPVKKYELVRRVTAENICKGNYILCDIGCVPVHETAVNICEMVFETNPKVGILYFMPHGKVRACRKGVIEKWPMRRTDSYSNEHEQAYAIEGYSAQTWPTLLYRQPNVH
jgi:hypothetical protein